MPAVPRAPINSLRDKFLSMAINLLTSLCKLTKNQFSASVGAILVQLRAKSKGKTKKTNAKIFLLT
jgi:hypothetical protein